MLFKQADKAVFINEIGLKSLKNSSPEGCWGFRRLAGVCLGAFFLVFWPIFRIELAFSSSKKSASSSSFLLYFLQIGRGGCQAAFCLLVSHFADADHAWTPMRAFMTKTMIQCGRVNSVAGYNPELPFPRFPQTDPLVRRCHRIQ